MNILDPRLHAVRSDLADSALRGRIEAPRFVDGTMAQVIAPSAPVRREPSSDSMLSTEAICGEAVTVFDTTEEGWAWVQLAADRYVGWIPREAISESAPKPTHTVSALRTLVFSGPDIKSPLVSSLPFGAAVAKVGEAEDKNARYSLIAPAGAVVVQHLALVDAGEKDWTGIAERFIGSPYLWGGKTNFGIDCSGLVQTALNACGIAAPRDSDMQEQALGEAVSPEAGLRRGDLVFWKGHVGIMRDAETLLHANSHHMAVVSELLQPVIDRMGKISRPASFRRIEAQ